MPRATTRLRATRANPPGLAARDDDRRAVFAAALQQAEDLYDASAAVGPFARPLPLFYAVSQAGRAIAAARTPSDWRVSGHGLAEDRSTSAWRRGDLKRFRVKPQSGPGVFGSVAQALGLPGLTGSVELGALWSALPVETVVDDEWPVALPVWPQMYAQERSLVLHIAAGHRGHVHLREQASNNDAAAIDALLANYPAAQGAFVEVVQTIIQAEQTPWGIGVPVRWPAPQIELSPEGPPPDEWLASQVQVRVPQYKHMREHWLLPYVGDGRDELPALLIWWVLLFALSLLARYEPAAWRAALDPDQSGLAVPLEHLLEEALTITPYLLYEVLTGESALLQLR
jgi:hypothetical protein